MTFGGLKMVSDILWGCDTGGGGGEFEQESGRDRLEKGCWCPWWGLFSIDVLLPCRNRSTVWSVLTIERREECIRILLMKRRLGLLNYQESKETPLLKYTILLASLNIIEPNGNLPYRPIFPINPISPVVMLAPSYAVLLPIILRRRISLIPTSD